MGYRRNIKLGTTSKIHTLELRSAANGNGLAGVAAASVAAWYVREGEAPVEITVVAGAQGMWSSGGWSELSGPRGFYELGIPDAALVSGAKQLTIRVQVSSAIDQTETFSLVAVDQDDAASFGVSGIGAAAIRADAAADVLEALTESVSGLRFTEHALEEAPTGSGGSGLTAQQVRDAMKLAPTAGDPAAGSVDEELDAIRAKPAGGGGGIAVVGPTKEQARELARQAAAEVWKAPRRSLTAPVEIAGDKRTLDALNDLSREEVRQEVDESNAEQTADLEETLDGVETQDSAAARAGKLGGAIFSRVDPVRQAVRDLETPIAESRDAAKAAERAALLYPSGFTADDLRAAAEDARVPVLERLAAIEESDAARDMVAAERHREVIDAGGHDRDLLENRIARLEAERDEITKRLSAKMATLDARLETARKQLATAVETSDSTLKLVAKGVGRLIERG